MRDLLFLSHRIPYPPDKGEKIRAWHMLEALARSHDIHLGCFIDDPADWAHLAHMRTVCKDVACFAIRPGPRRLRALARLSPGRPLSLDYFDDRRLRGWVAQKLGAGIDRVFVYCSAMAPYVMEAGVMEAGGPALRRVLDMVDVDSAKWRDYAAKARGPARLVWSREARTLQAFERRAALAFDRTLFVSQAEADCFADLAPECRDRVGFLDNGVDLQYFSPDLRWPTPFAAGPRHLVFTGTMDYRPNVDAVGWFVQAVMPLLRAEGWPVELSIVGANPAAAVRKLAGPDVHVTGRVADVRPFLANAALAIAPLRIARGIQNKVLEAMAMGRPVVASPPAFDGVRATPGRDLLVADGAAATAARIGEVLRGEHPGLGQAARRAMELGHAWDVTLAGLPALFGAGPPVPAAAEAAMAS